MSTPPSEALSSDFEVLIAWVLQQLACRRVSPVQAEAWLWTLVEVEEMRQCLSGCR